VRKHAGFPMSAPATPSANSREPWLLRPMCSARPPCRLRSHPELLSNGDLDDPPRWTMIGGDLRTRRHPRA
jgi:hypothetical protein